MQAFARPEADEPGDCKTVRELMPNRGAGRKRSPRRSPSVFRGLLSGCRKVGFSFRICRLWTGSRRGSAGPLPTVPAPNRILCRYLGWSDPPDRRGHRAFADDARLRREISGERQPASARTPGCWIIIPLLLNPLTSLLRNERQLTDELPLC